MSVLLLLTICPLVGALFTYIIGKYKEGMSGWIASAFSAASFLLVLSLYLNLSQDQNFSNIEVVFNWISFSSYVVDFSLTFDSLSSVMCLVITGIGSLIHLYSIGYMSEDKSKPRYFAYLNLFLFFMLLLVLGSNLLVTFVGWEGVGLCSYLLIGFWFTNSNYAEAGKKAFIVNRIGDAGFLIAMFSLFKIFGTLDYEALSQGMLNVGEGSAAWIMIAGIGLFIGATGKSAQIPLYTWLPDAMAGPTPVSALIHAATMVTAGIYLLTRMAFLFDTLPLLLEIIFYVAFVTSLLAGLIAISQDDLKKVLAYSTVSQLGFMFMAIGAGAYWIALFHVVTHAFFKACLFLSAGNIIHALNSEQNIKKMGGLRKELPFTFYSYLASTLAISAIYPFSGYFSKHLIIESVSTYNFNIYISILAALTVVYMGRSLYYVFFGSYRGSEHIHKPNFLMTFPVVVLAVGAAASGFLLKDTFLAFSCIDSICEFANELAVESLTHSIIPTAILLFIFLAYFKLSRVLEALRRVFKFPIYLSRNKFFIDELYTLIIVSPLRFMARFFNSFDNVVVDTTVESSAVLAQMSAYILKGSHRGDLRNYAGCILLFAFCLVFLCFLI